MAITIPCAVMSMWKNTSRALATVHSDLKTVTMPSSVTQRHHMSMINTSTVQVVGVCVETERFDTRVFRREWIGMIHYADALALSLGKIFLSHFLEWPCHFPLPNIIFI